MVRITSPIDASWSRANARAIEQAALGNRARPNGHGRYLAASSKGEVEYEVRILNVGTLDATCTCPCGQHPSGRAHCWHAASALFQEIARVSRPAPATSAASKMARFARP